MTVAMYKIVSGEVIVSEIIEKLESDTSTILLKNPTVLVMQNDQNGELQVGLAPFLALGSEKVNLYKSCIVAETEPDAALVKQYNQMFSSIILAN